MGWRWFGASPQYQHAAGFWMWGWLLGPQVTRHVFRRFHSYLLKGDWLCKDSSPKMQGKTHIHIYICVCVCLFLYLFIYIYYICVYLYVFIIQTYEYTFEVPRAPKYMDPMSLRPCHSCFFCGILGCSGAQSALHSEQQGLFHHSGGP